ncbi:MAG: lipid A deacylase LpxR family protein [Pseudomonadota bacterium]
MKTIGCFLILVAGWATGSTALAQPVLDDPRATWTLLVENDSFTREDDNYTSGAQIGYVSGTKPLAGFSAFLANTLVRPQGDAVTRRGFTLTHAFYTPDNLRPAGPQPGEHPWAGVFTAETVWMVQQSRRLDRFSVEVGLIGPSALAEPIQKAVHSITGDVEPQGWNNQIDDEFLLNFHYNVQKRFLREASLFGKPFDMIISGVVSAGNKYTGLGGGSTLRWGPGVTSTFSTPRVRTAINGGPSFFTERMSPTWHVYMGGDVRAVAHNIVLDDSFFRDENIADVSSEVIVSDFEIGAVVQIGKYQGAISATARSPQFEEESEIQAFAALSLSRKF